MIEQTTVAFVLGKENVSEQDGLVSLYTKDLGKVLARVTSGFKVASKLMPHLQVGSKTTVRLVERRLLRVADALSFPSSGEDMDRRLICLALLSDLSSELGPDMELWNYLEKGSWSSIGLLRILGLYGEDLKCNACKSRAADRFSSVDHGFYCSACVGAEKRFIYALF